MEPRPPRPRNPGSFEAASPPTAGIGERLYPRPGETTYYGPTETYPPGTVPEAALMPRRQRRKRSIIGQIAAVVIAIGLIAAAGWFFRDTFRNIVAPSPSPTPVPGIAAAGTPEQTREPEAPALPNALATVTPTAGPAATATSRPRPTEPADAEATVAPTPDRDISSQTLPLLEFLPTQSQMPQGLILADEAERSKAEVIAALGGTDEAAQLLDDWGWSGNAFRDFIADETNPSPNGTTFMNISVHRFADPASAANAMVYFSDFVIFEQGLQEVEAPAIGESARLLIGAPSGVPLAVLYAQDGPIMYRIGGSSSNEASDPSADVLALAQTLIPGPETEG